jgi:hypothetical protein
MARIDRDFLDVELTEAPLDGPYAEFGPGGEVLSFGWYRGGEPLGQSLHLVPGRRAGYLEQRQRFAFAPAPEQDERTADQAYEAWVRGALAQIVESGRSAVHAGLSCSFCGKGQREVRKLIAGPQVYICDECIGLCVDILATED